MHGLKMAAAALAATLLVGASPPKGDWNATVTVTPSGSHVIGNPKAAIKVAEYVSYTCPHCAHFHIESEGPLRVAYIPQGKVSVEVRHLVRDAADMTAALLTNCGDPKKFYAKHNAFLQTQEQWIKTMGTASDVQKRRWTTGEMPQRMRAIAADFGFYKIMEKHGYDRVTTDRCLADEAMAENLVKQTQAAINAGVTGTPSFMIDDTLLTGTHDWKALEEQINARM
ncbi:MAG: thioredoxin domain-containing protein [Novosphingobium sp.]|nr:thioredoxin domain-containing protein [Novosphingobium sp.]